MHSILVTDSGPIRTITLNRPAHRNALSAAMQHELLLALEDAATSKSTRVLVLTGAGSAFCAGLDFTALKEMAGLPMSSAQASDDAQRFSRVLRTLYELPIPTIAAVNGHAIAGGTGIATICDFTFAVPGALFGYTEVKIGFIPALVSIYLALHLGEKRARNLLLTGRVFTAAEAHHLGLVTEVVEPAELLPRTHALAETLIANSPTSLRDTKSLLADQNREWLDRALALALSASAASRQTPDFREGVTAFLEKRKPTWTE